MKKTKFYTKKDKGDLFIISTPIGNMKDITLRALETLKNVDILLTEDTRITKKILNFYQINCKKIISFNSYQEKKKIDFVIDSLLSGLDVGFVSDAGTPGISDPSYLLINKAIQNLIKIIAIPGPSAVITALSISGLPMNKFIFLGFLPSHEKKKIREIKSLSNEEKTIIIYESPKRIFSTLKIMIDILGERHLVVAREMTKFYEEISRGTLKEVFHNLQKIHSIIKGEITLILGGLKKTTNLINNQVLISMYLNFKKNDLFTTKDIIRQIVHKTHICKNQVYKIISNYIRNNI